MATVIGTVTSVQGMAIVVDTNGNRHMLQVGEVLHAGDKVITASGATVTVKLANGEVVNFAEAQTVKITDNLAQVDVSDVTENAVNQAVFDAVLTALNEGRDITEVLDAPAAGEAGSDGNASFVNLDRISESVTGATYDGGNGFVETAAFSLLPNYQYFPEDPTIDSVTPSNPPIPGSATPGNDQVIEGNSMIFTVGLSTPTQAPATYTFSIGGGTASSADYGTPVFSNGVTYNPTTQTITVPAGVSSFTVTVPTVDDTSVEPNETLPISVGGVVGVGIIVDNDRATVDTVTAGPNGGTVVEGNNLVYTVTLSDTTNAPTTYSFTLGGGTASAADYVTPPTFTNGVTYNAATQTITVPAGVKDFTVTVPTVDDAIVEPNETLPLNVGGVTAIGTIVDNDRATVVTVEPGTPDPNDDSVIEGNNLVYNVTLSATTNAPTTYTYTLGGGTASAADFGTAQFSNGVVLNANGTITVPAGVSSFTVTVPTVDDTIVEPNETLPLTIGGATGTGIIVDNDRATVVTVEPGTPDPNDDSVVEGNNLVYTVTLSATTNAPTTYAYSLGGGTASAADYGTAQFSNGVVLNANGTITVPAGVSSFTVTVPTVDDTIVEPNETLPLTIGGATGTGIIIDNDRATVVTVEPGQPGPGDDSVVEGTSLIYTVTLSATTNAPTTYAYSLGGGTASAADYGTAQFSNGVVLNANGTITVPAGVSSFTVTVPTVDDTIVEPNETLPLTIGGATGTGIIIDNDRATVDTVTAGPNGGTVVEGNNLIYTVTLSATTNTSTTYSFTLGGGTASAADYVTPPTFSNGVTYNAANSTITVPAGVKDFTVTVPTVDDTIVEPNETLPINVGGVTAIGTIEDNDRATVDTVTAGPNGGAVVEGNNLVYTVTLSATTNATTTYSFTLGGGTASAADYVTPPTFSNGVTYNAATNTITVPAGVKEFTVIVPTVDDTIVEPNETLPINVGGVAAIGTIVDNDRATVDTVTAGPNGGSVVEGNNLVYTVTLSAETNAPTTYSFTLGGGTASAADYVTPPTFSNGVTYNPANNTITVPAGVTSFTVTVPTVDDTLVEANETLPINVGGKNATGLIIDNDGGITTVNGSKFAVSEEGLAGGIKDNTGSSDTTDSAEATGAFSLNGSNAGAVWTLTAPTTPLTSGGVTVTWSLSADGKTLTGSAGNEKVLTVTINDSGEYKIVLNGQVDHPVANVEDTVLANVGVKVVVNGVTQTTTLPVTIEDDAPQANGGSVTVTNADTANVAPVAAVANSGNLLGLVGLSALNLIDLSTRSAFGATDANNNISKVELNYQSLVSLGGRQFTVSQALAAELGLKVVINNDPGFLTLIGPSSHVVITSLDGGPIDNLAINELLATARLSGGPISAEVLNGTSITVTDSQGASSSAAISTLVDATVLSSATANPNLKEGDGNGNTLTGTAGDDQIYGYAGNDTLNGGAGNDILRGGDGNDTLDAGIGNDILVGGSGNDSLTGGAGRDIFRWEKGDEGTAGSPAVDTVTDFTLNADVIDLRSVLQGESLANLSNYVRVTVENGNTILHISSTGGFSGGFNMAAENQTIVLQGVNLQTAYGTTDSTQILTNLVNSGNLAIDPAASTASGSLGAFGADGGHVQNIVVGGVTYTYNATNNTVSASGNSPAVTGYGYDAANHRLTVTTAKGETITVNMETGAYLYNGSRPLVAGETTSVGFTLIDNDGDTSSSSLQFNGTGQPTITTVEPGQPGTGDDSVVEGTSLVYTVTLSTAPNAPATYTYNLGGGTASTADYGTAVFSNGVVLNANGTITVPAGVSSFTVTVPTVDDTIVELNETLPLTIGGATGTGIIVDNDRATVDTITAGPNGGSVVEGNNLVYTVNLSATTNAPTTLSFTLGGGTASSADYVTPPTFSNGVTYNAANGTITIPAGVTSFTVTVPTVDDTLVEPNETLPLNIDGVTAVGTIVDNDRATVVTVEPGQPGPGDDSVVEGTSLVYTVTLSATTNVATTYTYSLGGGTASTADYGTAVFSNGVVLNANGTITVPAGVSSFTVTVPTVDDTIVELNETLPLTIGGATGTGVIVDNDRSTVVTVEPGQPGPGDDSVVEGASLVYTVTLSATTNVATTYTYSLGGGTASTADYGTAVFSNGVVLNANGTITVPAGVSSFTVTVPTVDDTIVELNETLPLTIGGATGTGIIVDNDRATIDTITAGPNGGSVVEGNNLVYTVTLSTATNAPTTYSYSLGGGTASSADYGSAVFSNGVTYNAVTGTITVPAGVSSFTVTVPTIDDTLIEPNETLPLNIGGKSATGIIIDNDSGITVVNGSKFTVSEEGLAGGIKDNAGSSDTTDSAVATGSFSLNASNSSGAVWTLTAPTAGTLTSGGVTVTWSLSADGKTLTGFAGNEKVLTATINNSGAYNVTLSKPIDHPNTTTEDTLKTEIGVKVVANGVTQVTTLPVTIEDDSPVANNQTVYATNSANTNVMITLDVSGSMGGRDGVGGQTRLASAIQSIKTLLASYDDLGDVKVALVVFAGDAQTRQLGTTWLTVSEANALLNTLSPNGNTNYDSALETAINAYGSPGKLDNAQTVSYFFTDGEPNRGLGGTSDLSGSENASSADAGIQAAEERAWIQFLETYNIKSYALGLGQNTSTTQLDPIAYDGQAGVNTGGVKVTNFDQLDGVLSETVAASISGSLVASGGFGADGGYVKSVAIEGTTYTFNATTGAITFSGTNRSTYDSASHKLSITTAKGTLVLDMDDGTFVFTPKNTKVSGVADFQYTLSDRDGDTSSATLSINVTKINAVPQVAPDVSTGINSAGLLTIPGLLNVDLLNFSSRQGFSASDVNNNITNVTITYSALIALSGAFLNYSSAVASELGLKVTYAQDNGFLGLIGGSGKLEVTSQDGGTIDNLKLNEFLSTIRTDNTIGVNVLDSFKISATDSTNLSDTDSSANLINIDLLTSGNSGIISGTSGNDAQINGTSGNDIIYGLAGDDTLNGGAGNDILRGGAGKDTLNGGDGNDILIGGKGNDTLTGGAGVDVFKWDRGDDGVAGNPARDTITDFNKATPGQGGDVLDIRDLLQGENPGNLQNYLHFEKSGSDTIIHISSNGGFANDAHNVSGSFSSGNTTQQIVLSGVDITTGQSSDAAIINSLLAQQKLIVDQ